jgi:hypothetical protein
MWAEAARRLFRELFRGLGPGGLITGAAAAVGPDRMGNRTRPRGKHQNLVSPLVHDRLMGATPSRCRTEYSDG